MFIFKWPLFFEKVSPLTRISVCLSGLCCRCFIQCVRNRWSVDWILYVHLFNVLFHLIYCNWDKVIQVCSSLQLKHDPLRVITTPTWVTIKTDYLVKVYDLLTVIQSLIVHGEIMSFPAIFHCNITLFFLCRISKNPNSLTHVLKRAVDVRRVYLKLQPAERSSRRWAFGTEPHWRQHCSD